MSDERDAEIERFVDGLFTNGAGTEATRLVLVKDNGPPTREAVKYIIPKS